MFYKQASEYRGGGDVKCCSEIISSKFNTSFSYNTGNIFAAFSSSSLLFLFLVFFINTQNPSNYYCSSSSEQIVITCFYIHTCYIKNCLSHLTCYKPIINQLIQLNCSFVKYFSIVEGSQSI